MINRILELVRSGEGNFQGCYRGLMCDSLDRGCIALILGMPDREAVAEFRKAVEFGVTLLTGRGTSHPFRSFEMRVNVSRVATS